MDLGIVMRTARDQLATVAMSYHTRIALHDYLIIGEETTLLFENGQLRDSERVLVEKQEETAGGPESPIARQDAEFFAAVRDGREPAVSARSVRPAMAALQAAQESLDAQQAALGPAAKHPRRP
jgi:2-hydroxy-4-carboxymuconate semialdehyde hemiacetal dehydrogenase